MKFAKFHDTDKILIGLNPPPPSPFYNGKYHLTKICFHSILPGQRVVKLGKSQYRNKYFFGGT